MAPHYQSGLGGGSTEKDEIYNITTDKTKAKKSFDMNSNEHYYLRNIFGSAQGD